MLGKKSVYAEEAHNGNFIGAGWFGDIDLSKKLPDNWRDFNGKFIPLYLKENPEGSKVAAGLACGMLYTIAKGILIGDIVLCPDGKGNYFVGDIIGDYEFKKNQTLPHRRSVRWYSRTISREEMSESLRNSAGSIGTVSNVTRYADEIEALISGCRPASIISTDETIEDPSIFALEKHLEDFLVQNWHHTELGKHYDIYEEDGEKVGQQYPSDTGPIDILAISKNKKEILVVELKKGRVSDVVVGQVQRYMGYVKEELAEKNQEVKGVIIAFEDDVKIHRALSVANNIDFYTYKIHFELKKK
ncbi:MAG: endonuclease NucS domain-containing protein [Candidatus Paceibacterota bacterium]|jgi:restriction system protein